MERRILIVEDEKNIVDILRFNLQREGYATQEAYDGEAGLEKALSGEPDLVLLDYEMPVCDGKQTLEMLRSDEAFADVPVIFLTGRRDPKTMIDVMPLNPSGYLIKTSKPEEIKKEVDQFFAKQKK